MAKLGRFVAACAAALVGFSAMAALLPSEYQEVEYVQSDGNQRINTGIAIKDSHELQFKYAMLTLGI